MADNFERKTSAGTVVGNKIVNEQLFLQNELNTPRGDPLSSWLGRRRLNKKVASNLLKIGHRVAYRLALIATRGFRARQNSYGFRAI